VTVQDKTGAELANAAVIATNVETMAIRVGETSGDGRFLFSQLNPGNYTVTVRVSGFAEQTSRPVEVEVGRTVTLNLSLTVSSSTQTVEVDAQQAMLSLENPNTTTTIEAKTIGNLPNPGQDLTYLAQFAPGALMNTAGSSNDAKAAGVRQCRVQWSARNLQRLYSGRIRFQRSLSWFEYRSLYEPRHWPGRHTGSHREHQLYAVDQGRYGASQVNYLTKSGSNRFRGDCTRFGTDRC